MNQQPGTFTVEDAFRIVGRGWVLVGEVKGRVSVGARLDFGNTRLLNVTGVESINDHQAGKVGLLISAQFASRQEVLEQNIIGVTALVLE